MTIPNGGRQTSTDGLDSRTILVTGAASGIGQSVASFLAERGHEVVAVDLSPIDASEGILPIQADITNAENLRNVVKQLESAGKDLYGIVHCAGIARAGPLVEVDEKDIWDILRVNMVGMAIVTKAFFPMLQGSQGRIITVSSLSGRITSPFMGPYCISKYAVEAYSDALRRELDPLGIKVSTIEPGKILTPLIEKNRRMFEEGLSKVSPTFRSRALRFVARDEIRVQKNGLPAEIVAQKVFHALFSKKPKIRYLIVKHPLRTKLLLSLPDRMLDRMFRKI